MANVIEIRGRRGDERRGQFLLITGLTLAVILVTVALLLNTAIFTENVATRDTTTDGREALGVRGSVVNGVGELIERENYGEHDEVEDVIDDVEVGVDSFVMDHPAEAGPHPAREHAQRGTVVAIERVDAPAGGSLLRWDDPETSRTFDAGGPDWVLVDDVTRGRAFRLTLDSSSLWEASAPNGSQLQNNSFGVRFTDSAGSMNLTQFVYEDDGDVIIARVDDSGDLDARCRIGDTGDVQVDLTGDRLERGNETVRCFEDLWPDADEFDADEFDPETIRIVNGDAAEGTFTLTVDDGVAVPEDDSGIRVDPAVYSVTIDLVYVSPSLEFETRVRVAPGEPR